MNIWKIFGYIFLGISIFATTFFIISIFKFGTANLDMGAYILHFLKYVTPITFYGLVSLWLGTPEEEIFPDTNEENE